MEDKRIFRYTFIKERLSATKLWTGKDRHMAKAKVSGKATRKTAVRSASTKAGVKRTARKTTGMTKGSSYTCGVCGLIVTVDTACGCAEPSHLICCEKPMRKKR